MTHWSSPALVTPEGWVDRPGRKDVQTMPDGRGRAPYPEDRRRAWYLQLGITIVLAGVLCGAAFLLGDRNADWPVPAALVVGALAAPFLARAFAYRRRRE